MLIIVHSDGARVQQSAAAQMHITFTFSLHIFPFK
uniref:Uncharacterized protein n=1 Tax=Anguilla anguilla TaxID=7936 RepID=A0A0E9UEA2_ANGAN